MWTVCVCLVFYAHAQYAKNTVIQNWKGLALRFLTTLLLYSYKRACTHASACLSGDARSVLTGGSTCCRRLWSERRLAGAFSAETAGGWLILYLKGSGLDSRLLAQRKSIVDVEVTQAAFKQTVGSHLSGIRVCVTWRRRCNSPQFCPQEGKVPEGFWRPCWRDFSLLLPTPLISAAAHIQHKLSSKREETVTTSSRNMCRRFY